MIGRLSFSIENGALRHFGMDGTEAIRGIAFLVRDGDWGTLVPQITDETLEASELALRLQYQAQYKTQTAELTVKVSIQADQSRLIVSATGRAKGHFETNRAGFTVLHPIRDVAGAPVRVDHSDGTSSSSHFPSNIEPWQPFKDISALTHNAGTNAVTCRFKGDTFEMEDQRQWGDASYKTYNRPLAEPWPYLIPDGTDLRQSVEVTWQTTTSANASTSEEAPKGAHFPQMALVISPDDAARLALSPIDLEVVKPQRLLCHLDATLGDTSQQFVAFAQAQAACPSTLFDLELICRCDANPEPELQELAAQMAASGFAPYSIMVCPSVDRQSTPPGSDWPDCPSLELIHNAAANAFPCILRGGGMASFFPELNRKRPPVAMLDFISHGLCPIVHAADDLSVMETLEAISHITRSARSIIKDKAYRIGPATIAMRQNPYGKRTIPNTTNGRVCMTDDDPRHRAKFGAAYAIGLATALAPSGIEVWTPASLYGPRGVIRDQGVWPLTDALRLLGELAGQPVRTAEVTASKARLTVRDTAINVNLTAQMREGLGPYEWQAIA
ncbi:hypothetical protein [Flavimaricola marinus]|uniref:hypothetical protein n=1 Tax=Flavimaricola marinus TaxID=1819565 RepID=UPI001FE458BB|nr:hypothetical protein [Flavimaricola marinus]